MRTFLLAGLLLTPLTAAAQWQLLDSRTTADLRGVASVGKGVVWASGTNGTVLRSEDGGYMWQGCTVPPGAEKLDFRGVQAFDENTAIVMSSGPGDASRLYKTTDGCQTWKLVFTNPDKEGFWDAIVATPDEGFIIGDPVGGHFMIYQSSHANLERWTPFGAQSCFTCPVFDHRPFKTEALFAASNSVLEGSPRSNVIFVTGGGVRALFHGTVWSSSGIFPTTSWTSAMPLAIGPTAGAFSFASGGDRSDLRHFYYVAVGGDYKIPDSSVGTAAYSKDGGVHWKAALRHPQGYRSAVAYDAATKAWITVGPNGTDVSTDDGRNWRAVRPDMSLPDAQVDEDAKWNALSLPFVVGPKGRIGKLRAGVVGAK